MRLLQCDCAMRRSSASQIHNGWRSGEASICERCSASDAARRAQALPARGRARRRCLFNPSKSSSRQARRSSKKSKRGSSVTRRRQATHTSNHSQARRGADAGQHVGARLARERRHRLERRRRRVPRELEEQHLGRREERARLREAREAGLCRVVFWRVWRRVGGRVSCRARRESATRTAHQLCPSRPPPHPPNPPNPPPFFGSLVVRAPRSVSRWLLAPSVTTCTA